MKTKTSQLIGKFLIALTFFCAGRWLHVEQSTTRALASETIPSTLNSYESLPCPSDMEFQKMAQDFHLVLEDDSSLDGNCDHRYKAKLSKVFRLMKLIKPAPPEHWPKEIRADLSDTYAYLKNHVKKLTLDLNQVDSIAYNRVSEKEIYIGEKFFSLPPLDGMMVLFHEARHSSSLDPGHTSCSAGDLPRVIGACDQQFSFEQQHAGAYSYGTILGFSLSFYTEGLAESDKQFVLLDAITQLGARFNELPEVLAQKVDVLAVLDTNGKLSLIHPFINAKLEVPLAFSDPSEKPERIEFSVKMNGLTIFTNLGNAYTWSSQKGLSKFFPEVIKGKRIIALNRVSVPLVENNHFTFIDADQNIQYIKYSPAQNLWVSLDFIDRKFLKLPTQFPVLKNLVLGLYADTVFLTTAGQVYFAPHYALRDLFQDFAGINMAKNHYIYATGGVIYDSLFLIEQKGSMYNVLKEIDMNAPSEDESTSNLSYIYSLHDSEYKNKNGLLKFQEGLQVNAGLDQQNRILLWNKNSFEYRTLNLTQVKDFVLIQHTGIKKQIVNSAPIRSDFLSTCNVQTQLDDFWLGWGFGKTRNGELVFADKSASERTGCVVLPHVQLELLTPYFDSAFVK